MNETSSYGCETDNPEETRRTYDAFYGPLPDPLPAPAYTARHATPAQTASNRSFELEHDIFGGESPLSSAASSRSPSPTKNSKKRSQNKKSKAKRAKKRRAARAVDLEASRQPVARSAEKNTVCAEAETVDYSAKDIPSASTGYVAMRDKSGGVFKLHDLMERGFTLVKWDRRSAKPIVDSNGLVVAVLVGRPSDSDWEQVHKDAFELLRASGERCNFTHKCMNHRRGNFAALNYGISFGGRPQRPGNLSHSQLRSQELQKLVNSKPFDRLAGFASGAFAAWMPRLYKAYDTCLQAVVKNDGNLRRNFKGSVWAAAAFNYGPRTVTQRHRDAANLPHGICSVTALGRYNYVQGGHVVLWEFRLVVEFPPGSTILIPSAAVTHSNTPVGDKEERCSFTQYSAGGLFRWADQGFQKKDKYLALLSKEELAKLPEKDKARCALGMSLFSTLDELCGLPKKVAAPTDLLPPPPTA